MHTRVRNLFVAFLLAVAPAFSGGAREFTPPSEPSAQTAIVRTTGGADTTGWVLIAMVHGPEAALVREGQQVRAFSVNARTRVHLARITRVTRRQGSVRVEATLATRVLGISTRYLMEIVTESI